MVKFKDNPIREDSLDVFQYKFDNVGHLMCTLIVHVNYLLNVSI